MLEPFAGYGFNKSHAAAYSVVAYQTAYLKANYPVEFMAANLTNEINSPDKLTQYINETRAMGIPILPPDINLSKKMFNTVDGKIVYGLNGIKNVGSGAVEEIIREREEHGPYTSFLDFLNRIDTKVTNRKVMESLIQSGAFDALGINRATLQLNLEKATEYVSRRKEAEKFGQASLFDMQEEEELGNFELEPAEDISLAERLQIEKQLLGFYFSGHPMDEFKDSWKRSVRVDLSRPDHLADKHPCNLLGMVTSVRTIVTKKGLQMAFIQIEDFNGSIEMVIFPKIWELYKHLVTVDAILGFTGKIDLSKGKAGYLVDTVVAPEALSTEGIKEIHIKLSKQMCNEEFVSKLRDVCLDHSGKCGIYLHIADELNEAETIVKASGQIGVAFSDDFIDIVKEIPMVQDVWFL